MKTLEELNVLIIGLGQIGGSLGMDLVKRRLVSEVVGLDTDKAAAGDALGLGVADRMGYSLEEELPRADLVILAAPIREISKLIPYVGQRMSAGAAILDVGSTKAEILASASQLPASIDFIGGHPLTGTEKSGPGAALAGKFTNTTFVLIPSERTGTGTGSGWLGLIEDLVRAIGARPLRFKADEHDRLIALTSNLPYLLAVALVQLAAETAGEHERLPDLVGGSFRSATRVAESSPQLTLDMFMTNRGNILDATDRMIVELSRWKGLIESGDEASLRLLVEEVKQKAEVIRNG